MNVEENKVEASEIPAPDNAGEQQSETLSPTEQAAREMGWVPQEEYQGEQPWVSAETFVARKPLFEKIEGQSKALKELKRDFQTLIEHNKKVEQAGYARAIQEFKIAKKAALSEGDLVEAENFQEKIDELKEEQSKQPTKTQTSNELEELASSWIPQNQWYTSHPEARNTADALAIGFVNQGLAPADVLQKVTLAIKKQYPELFKNPMRNIPSQVDGSSTKSSPTKSEKFELSFEERRVMERMIDMSGGTLKEADYIKQLKDIKKGS